MGIQANAIVTLIIDGVSYERWDVKSGGQTTAEITKHRPGGTVDEVQYDGLPTTEDVTLNRAYDRARDHVLLARLHNKVGNGEIMVSWQPTDGNMIPTADDPITRPGKLAGAPSLGPDYDSTSSDKQLITVTLSIPYRRA